MAQAPDWILSMQEGIFTLRDLKRNKHLAGTLFNILFNLNKFVAFETRDPFTIRQACHTCAGPHLCLCQCQCQCSPLCVHDAASAQASFCWQVVVWAGLPVIDPQAERSFAANAHSVHAAQLSTAWVPHKRLPVLCCMYRTAGVVGFC